MPQYDINGSPICPIENPYEVTADCDDNSKAGVKPNAYITAYFSMDSIVTDSTDFVDDFVSIINMRADNGGNPEDIFYPFHIKDKSGLLETIGTLNDNDNVVETDTFTCQGLAVGKEAFRFARQLKNKQLCIIIERSDETPLIIGWKGGLKCTEWKYSTGTVPSSDFHGFDFTFVNDTEDGVRIIEPDATTYVGGFDDMITEITA
jgi:hypothetical protein